MNRASFIIDGFNLYHSAKDAQADLGGASTKWLNIWSLCESTLSLISRDAQMGKVFYFSALAKHLLHSDPDVVARHENYIRCLESTGITVELADFKPKEIMCSHCTRPIVRHEEKETDVAIASKIFELCYTNDCEVIVVVSGDTDIKPAIKYAQRLFPTVRILFAFPHRRRNQILVDLAPGSFRIKKERYTQHQFPNPVDLGNGTFAHKPISW